MADLTIIVRYSCHRCDQRDISVAVPARTNEEDVVKWMEQMIAHIGRHHRTLNPQCTARKMYDLKIPIEGAEWIGCPPIQ